jgi:hypothetical protein
MKMIGCMEDKFTFHKSNNDQSGHPKSKSSQTQGGFKGDQKKMGEVSPQRKKILGWKQTQRGFE